jgi:LPXTG-motif cell wall-anchored protein
MDWIEQLFGIDPDFGSGSLEMLIAGAIVVVALGAVFARRRKTTATADEKVR